MIHRISTAAFLLAPLIFISSCRKKVNDVTVRPLSPAEQDFKIPKNTAERFRYTTRSSASQNGGGKSPSAASQGSPSLAYKTPRGWKEIPGSAMRDINLTFGKNGEGECYLTRLPGSGGGLLANVNRWRKQMGAPPLSAEEVAALPKKTLFHQSATLVDVTGNFGGMGGADAKKNYRLLGLILSFDTGAIFVKMTGPKALVDSNTSQFDQFVASLDVNHK